MTTREELEGLTVSQLKGRLNDIGISGVSRLRREELIDKLLQVTSEPVYGAVVRDEISGGVRLYYSPEDYPISPSGLIRQRAERSTIQARPTSPRRSFNLPPPPPSIQREEPIRPTSSGRFNLPPPPPPVSRREEQIVPTPTRVSARTSDEHRGNW